MSEIEENKEATTVVKEHKQEYTRGPSGEKGEPTASLTIKQRYHQAHFDRVDAEDKRNPNKKRWVKHTKAPSLKEFARQLVSQGDTVAKDWFEQKAGALNEKRTDANEALARTCAAATKLEKRKKSVAGGKK